MKQLKRFALACLLAASLSAVAAAGQMDTTLNGQMDTPPAPGQMDTPPGQMDTPAPTTSTSAGEMNCPISGADVLTVAGALVSLLG
jgi:hypothetical protein